MHKAVFTEGDNFYQSLKGRAEENSHSEYRTKQYRFFEDSLKESKSKEKLEERSMNIAPQFSLNILSNTGGQLREQERDRDRERVRFRKPTKLSHHSDDGGKWATSLQGLDRVQERDRYSDAKSLLQLMARSVEVRAEPTS